MNIAQSCFRSYLTPRDVYYGVCDDRRRPDMWPTSQDRHLFPGFLIMKEREYGARVDEQRQSAHGLDFLAREPLRKLKPPRSWTTPLCSGNAVCILSHSLSSSPAMPTGRRKTFEKSPLRLLSVDSFFLRAPTLIFPKLAETSGERSIEAREKEGASCLLAFAVVPGCMRRGENAVSGPVSQGLRTAERERSGVQSHCVGQRGAGSRTVVRDGVAAETVRDIEAPSRG